MTFQNKAKPCLERWWTINSACNQEVRGRFYRDLKIWLRNSSVNEFKIILSRLLSPDIRFVLISFSWTTWMQLIFQPLDYDPEYLNLEFWRTYSKRFNRSKHHPNHNLILSKYWGARQNGLDFEDLSFHTIRTWFSVSLTSKNIRKLKTVEADPRDCH